ncbi:2'-5' RNA ligase family protein [Yinghuangia sp. YIM S09857]|uniref:2'-5' RNA ligase family protein n=1 Tax=Yinghuangia sp. YIM S09857 TaxID=3436929 RepID=UPI003F533E91
MPYGIILLPDEAANSALSAYAERLTAGVPAIMRIGEANLPHVTLAHVDATGEQAAELWARCAESLPARIEVKFSGLQFGTFPVGDRYLPQGGVYVGLEALRRTVLEAAHRCVADHAHDLGLPVVSGAGEDFRPHVTLAALETAARVSAPLPPGELLAVTAMRPAWGEMGRYGTFSHIEAVAVP